MQGSEKHRVTPRFADTLSAQNAHAPAPATREPSFIERAIEHRFGKPPVMSGHAT